MPAEHEYVPEGYVMPYKLEELGVSKDDSSFVAIVHIDGNGMGKHYSFAQIYENS